MSYEKWSLGYEVLRKYIQFADWIIHKKVMINGKENIPLNKPIIFAPNHQNALSDPLSIVLHTKTQPVWLARADIFKNKTIASILKFLKIMPVYRMRDGKENLLKNDTTFDQSIHVLVKNGALALFPEAAHSGKRQMLAHKKAVPRIVFMAMEKAGSDLDIQIIPTGIYYSSYWKFNRTVVVNFGKPIAAKAYFEEFKNNENNAIQSLRQRIYDELLPLVIEIKSTKHYNDYEKTREIYSNQFLRRQKKWMTVANRFTSEQLLIKKLEALEDKNPEEAEKLFQMLRSYHSKLDEFQIRSWLIENPFLNLTKILINNIIMLVTLPIFLAGFILNGIPFLAISYFNKRKVSDVAFWSSYSLVFGIVLFPIYYILFFLIFGWFIPGGLLVNLGLFLAAPFIGKLSFKWVVLFLKTVGRGHLLELRLFNQKEFYSLFREKDVLFRKLDDLLPL